LSLTPELGKRGRFSKVSYGKKAGLVARFETYQLLLITQVLHHNIAKETLVPQAKNNSLWKNGMLEYWNIGKKLELTCLNCQ
jgi:hypothetical protein